MIGIEKTEKEKKNSVRRCLHNRRISNDDTRTKKANQILVKDDGCCVSTSNIYRMEEFCLTCKHDNTYLKHRNCVISLKDAITRIRWSFFTSSMLVLSRFWFTGNE
jgi:hypothetical protein